MTGTSYVPGLEEVLRRMASAGDGDAICIEHLLDSIGQRSIGSLMLIPSLILISPLSGVPGLSSFLGITIALVAVQLVIGRDFIWLPRRVRSRCIERHRMEKVVTFLHPVARVVDRLVGPRLTILTRPPFSQIIAAVCMVGGLIMPPLEMVPFSSSVIATAIALFSLSLVAHDGVLAIVALVITLAGVYFGLGAIV